MSESQARPANLPDPNLLDPVATQQQAAAFAEHLERLGVQWLPAARPDAAQAYGDWFQNVSADISEAAAESPADSVQKEIPKPNNPNSPSAPANTPTTTGTASPAVASPAEALLPSEPYAIAALPLADRQQRIQTETDRVAACERCEILTKCRTKTVYGEGNPMARFAFFGEGPGRDEDLAGRPFVGKAGQLLTKMINACQLSREEVYILNTVKCRPPNNRNPEPAEIENCREYFEAQFQIIQPEYIVCMGLVSAQALLRTKLSVGRLRGKLHRYFDSKVLVTYHPAYLLRAPQAKRAAWADLQLMLKDAGLLTK
ncbi:MAG: uracil-DNA glycosylase [Planctomycetota bacterium]